MAGVAAAVAQVEPTAQENQDNFAAAFAQIAALDNGVEPAAPKPEEKAAEPVAEVSAKDVEPAEPAQPESLPTPEEEAARVTAEALKPPVKETAPELTDDDLVKRLAGMIKKAEPAAPVRETVETREPEVPYSSEESELLENYVKDFPDVARAEALIRRQEYQTVVGYVFQEISKELQPMMQMLRTLSERTHLGDLQTAVPDYNDLRTQVIDWAGKQPAYLQPAYNYVIQHGTVNEVADLIQRFKQNTGVQMAPAVTPKAEAELAPETKRAVAALAPVGSKRSAPVSVPSPDDFDGAFAEAAKSL